MEKIVKPYFYMISALIVLFTLSGCSMLNKFSTSSEGKTYLFKTLESKYHEKFSVTNGELVNNSWESYYEAALKDSKNREFVADVGQKGQLKDNYSRVFYYPKAVQEFYPLIAKNLSFVKSYYIYLDVDESADKYPENLTLENYSNKASVNFELGVVVPYASKSDAYAPEIKVLIDNLATQKINYRITVYTDKGNDDFSQIFMYQYQNQKGYKTFSEGNNGDVEAGIRDELKAASMEKMTLPDTYKPLLQNNDGSSYTQIKTILHS